MDCFSNGHLGVRLLLLSRGRSVAESENSAQPEQLIAHKLSEESEFQQDCSELQPGSSGEGISVGGAVL